MPCSRRIAVLALLAAAGALALSLSGTASRVVRAGECTRTATPASAQSVIDGARAGSTICLEAGVYRGALFFGNKDGLTVRGAGPRVTIVAGGNRDGLIVDNSRNITFENFTLYFGNPSNAYVRRSTDIVFRQMDVGGGQLGIHFDEGSRGVIADSFVYAMTGDGILTRRGANVTVERNWVFVNGGVGISTVGETANTNVIRNIISDNRGPGVFAGQTPCALLPPGFVEVPECYLSNLRAYVGSANVILDTNVIQASGSTGIVMFPGTRLTMRGNRIWRNVLSGLFAWGANVTSEGDEYDGNEEHAIEFRAYPDPLKYPQAAVRIRAVGRINNNNIHNTVVLPETGTLGGGVLAQGANLDVANSMIWANRGIGVSYVNTSLGSITNNRIFDNRGSGICLFRAGQVNVSGNVLTNNVSNAVGVCRETTP